VGREGHKKGNIKGRRMGYISKMAGSFLMLVAYFKILSCV
jgi:hypothetical protein